MRSAGTPLSLSATTMVAFDCVIVEWEWFASW